MSASNTGELDPNALGLKVDAEMNFTPDTGARYVFWWLEGAENCFASQTLITTPLGNKPIDSLERRYGIVNSSAVPKYPKCI